MVFRKLPLRALFEQNMKRVFFELDYSAPETTYVSEVVKLSRAGAAELADLMEQFRGQVHALADRDAQAASAGRTWIGVLSVMRELDLAPLREAQWDMT
jgi:hypothetical protein